jgi:hypothetical protein
MVETDERIPTPPEILLVVEVTSYLLYYGKMKRENVASALKVILKLVFGKFYRGKELIHELTEPEKVAFETVERRTAYWILWQRAHERVVRNDKSCSGGGSYEIVQEKNSFFKQLYEGHTH